MKYVCTSFLLGILIILGVAGCKKSSGANVEPRPELGRTFIPIAQANQMIESYQSSIGYPEKDDQIRSWVLNADSLRLYLQDPSIKFIKVSLAHQIDYLNRGFKGKKPADGEIPETIILLGVDKDSNYVTIGGRAMDNAVPCPRACAFAETILE